MKIDKNLVNMKPYDEKNSIFLENFETFQANIKRHRQLLHLPVHWHDNYLEIELILDGEGIESLNGIDVPVKKGSMTVLSYTDIHTMTQKDTLTFININVAYDFLDNSIKNHLAQNSNIMCQLEGDDFEYVSHMCHKLVEYTDKKDDKLILMTAKYLISSILMEAFSRTKSNTIGENPGIVQKIIQYINTNINKELTLEGMANHFNTSANYMGKLFKKHVGVSFNDYVNKVKLKHACTLIVSSNSTIKEIAHSCGFGSLEYFYYVFKKYNKMTPSQYRDSYRQ